MNDPKRLLEDGASDLERDLLGAGARLSSPRGMEARVWQGVGAKLSAAAVGGAVAASTTKAAASVGGGAGGAAVGGGAAAGGVKAGAAGVLAFKTKLVVAAIVVAGASTGGALVATRSPEPTAGQNMQTTPTVTTPSTARERRPDDAPRPRVSPPGENAAPVEAATVEPAPIATTSVESGTRRSAKPTNERLAAREAARPMNETSSTPAPASPKEPEPKGEAASRLRDDARALQEARAALGAGDPGAAEQRLAAISPTTALAPERDALRVRVAAARGDHARSAALASAFLRAYPKSPLAPQMEKFVGHPSNE